MVHCVHTLHYITLPFSPEIDTKDQNVSKSSLHTPVLNISQLHPSQPDFVGPTSVTRRTSSSAIADRPRCRVG